MKLSRRLLMRIGCICIAALLLCQGCDDDDYLDHNPPEGQGSIVVDNLTAIDFELFVDGEFIAEVDGGRERIVDVDTGIRRVVLDDSDDIVGSFREDIDVLEGRLTILRVYPETTGPAPGYVVTIEFD